MTIQTSPASFHVLSWYSDCIAKAIDALQFTQQILHIQGINTAEAQEETYHRKIYGISNYWILEEEQFSILPDTACPILLAKDNAHLLHYPSVIHVHLPGAFWLPDMNSSDAQ